MKKKSEQTVEDLKAQELRKFKHVVEEMEIQQLFNELNKRSTRFNKDLNIIKDAIKNRRK